MKTPYSQLIAAGMALSHESNGVTIPRGTPPGSVKCPECGKSLCGRIALSQHLQDKHGYSKRESKR